MAYRRPGVTVTQEFVGLVPALAAVSLPSVVVGPAFQIVDDDELGTYAGNQTTFAYGALLAGAQVDLAEKSATDPYDDKKPVSIFLRDAEAEIYPLSATGETSGTSFNDPTGTPFAAVLAGDLIRIATTLGVTVLAAQMDGVSTDTVGQRNRLTAGTAGQFDDVKEGDTVVITAGTNTVVGSYTVLIKISDDVLVLDADINDGVGPSADVAYSITGDRGGVNVGDYRVKEVTDDNNLVTESPFAEAEELVSYSIIREVGDVELARVASLPGNGFTVDETGITLSGSATLLYDATYPLVAGSVEASYRALRNDLAAEVKEYTSIADIEAVFGTGQITPANPLAFGLQTMLLNTVTAVNGLGLSGDYLDDEVTAFTAAADVLTLTEMYAIAPQSQNPVVHGLFKNHVDQLSLPEQKKERVAIVNSRLIEKATLQDESTTVTDLLGSRTIVPTQVDGAANVASPTQLTDATPDQFANVLPGDQVTVSGGTNHIAGTFSVVSKTDNNTLVLDGAIISGGTPSDFEYVIQRLDGLDGDGETFYDRNANFITNGVTPGTFIEISAPSGIAARHKVATVVSEVELTIVEIVTVTENQPSVTYEANRDFTKTEQAENVAGYSEAFGSRRLVHCWPDIVDMSFGNNVIKMPGYHLCMAVAALTTGLPPHQGYTNLAVAGFLGFEHSTGYFSDAQLDVIADGGTMIFAQDGDAQPLFIRHQLTTDRSAIKFQEYSVTKNVDFIAKFLRNTYARYIGTFNIVDTTIDDLKSTAQAAIRFLRDNTSLPKIGSAIRGGRLVLLAESETQIDTVDIRFSFDIPIPLNNIDIVIEV